jgi:hypothetical protein
MKARAALLYEESAVKVVKRKHAGKQNHRSKRHTKKGKSLDEEHPEPSESEHDNSDEDPLRESENTPNEADYCRSIDPSMRRWIDTNGCRNDVVDATFDNPARPRAQKSEPVPIFLYR